MMLGLVIALAVFVAGGLGALAYVYQDESATPRLVCLMYHRFIAPQEYRALRGTERIYSMPTDHFEAQLQKLNDLHYHSVGLDDAIDFAAGKKDLPQPAVLITIDDGCRSVATRAEPILRRYGHRAVLFVTTDPSAYVFNPKRPEQTRLGDDELRALDPGVIEIAAHGVTHRPLRALPDDALLAELRDSRNTLESILHRPIRAMAIPGNWYNDRVLAAAHDCGYDAVFTSEPGAVRPGDAVMELPRLNVAAYDKLDKFTASLGPGAIARRRVAYAIRRLPGRLIGPRIWEPLQRVIRRILTPRGFNISAALAIMIALAALAATFVALRRSKAP